MSRIFLLRSREHDGIYKIIIVPHENTIDFLLRDFLLKNCDVYKYVATNHRRNVAYFWLHEEDFDGYANLDMEKLDKKKLSSDVPFSSERINAEEFIKYLKKEGCLILEPEYVP